MLVAAEIWRSIVTSGMPHRTLWWKGLHPPTKQVRNALYIRAANILSKVVAVQGFRFVTSSSTAYIAQTLEAILSTFIY